MDYLPKAIDNGVVDSPLSRGVPAVVNLPSPLLDKATVDSLKSKY